MSTNSHYHAQKEKDFTCFHCGYQWWTFWSLMVIEINNTGLKFCTLNTTQWEKKLSQQQSAFCFLFLLQGEIYLKLQFAGCVMVEILIINLYVRRVCTICNSALVMGWHNVMGQALCNGVGNGSDRRKMH